MKKKILSTITSLAMTFTLMCGVNVSAATATTKTPAKWTISQNGINFICGLEGFSAKCYYDGNQSSIGYGTKCGTKAHKSGMHSITKSKAKTAMKSEINKNYIKNVRKQASGIKMTQNQFDALVSFTYNTGGGTTMIKNSPLVKFLKGKLSASKARSQYANYIVTDSATGKVSQGLINRRKKEADLFFKDAVTASDTNQDPTPSSSVTYFKKYTGSSASIVEALKAIGEDSSLAYRKKIAAANSISSYTGTAAQNTQMLNLLKSGKLIKPESTSTSTSTVNYFKKYTGSSASIVEALKAIGEESSLAYRKKIAAVNEMSNYTGTASQNTAMLKKLKSGVLIKP